MTSAALPPLPDEPIKRVWCLATVWLTCAGVVLDVMPTTCVRDYGHSGWHKAASRGGSLGSVQGPEITWTDSEVTMNEGAA